MNGVSYRVMPRKDPIDQLIDAMIEQRIAERIAELGGAEIEPDTNGCSKERETVALSEPAPKSTRGRRPADKRSVAMKEFITSELESGLWMSASIFHTKAKELGLSTNYASRLGNDVGIERRQSANGWEWRLPIKATAVAMNGHLSPEEQERARLRACDGLDDLKLGRR